MPDSPDAEFSAMIAGREIVPVDLDSVVLDPANARSHGPDSIRVLKGLLTKFGQTEPIGIQASTRTIIWGNGRVMAMRELGWTQAGAVVMHVDNVTATAMSLASNRSAERSTWDFDTLAANLKALDADAFDVDLLGWDQTDLEGLLAETPDLLEPVGATPSGAGSLAERFGVPPFSVLDARQGYWQNRKRAWLSLGIKSELGRGGHLEGV